MQPAERDSACAETTHATTPSRLVNLWLCRTFPCVCIVLDLWIEWWRKNRCRGDVVIVRYRPIERRCDVCGHVEQLKMYPDLLADFFSIPCTPTTKKDHYDETD